MSMAVVRECTSKGRRRPIRCVGNTQDIRCHCGFREKRESLDLERLLGRRSGRRARQMAVANRPMPGQFDSTAKHHSEGNEVAKRDAAGSLLATVLLILAVGES